MSVDPSAIFKPTEFDGMVFALENEELEIVKGVVVKKKILAFGSIPQEMYFQLILTTPVSTIDLAVGSFAGLFKSITGLHVTVKVFETFVIITFECLSQLTSI